MLPYYLANERAGSETKTDMNAKYFPVAELAGLPCITIWQPWAWCIFHAKPIKDVENRTWERRDLVGKLLAIHAGLNVEEFHDTCELIQRNHGVRVPPLPADHFGAILGVVRVTGFTRSSTSRWAVPGKVHWQLAEARPVQTPVKHRGAMGIFTVQLQGDLI
jgi:hypothetical protein